MGQMAYAGWAVRLPPVRPFIIRWTQSRRMENVKDVNEDGVAAESMAGFILTFIFVGRSL
jgi:hypothetical protein